MKVEQDPLHIIVIEPTLELIASLIPILEKSPNIEIIKTSSPAEAFQVASQFLPCIMLVSIQGSLDGQGQLDALKKLEKPIRSGQLKALVISSVKRHPLATAISSLGITDYSEEPVPVKSLQFKLNRMITTISRAKGVQLKEETVVIKKSETPEQKIEKIIENRPNYKPALQLAEDTFVFKGAQPRSVGNLISLEVEGPDPEDGEWVESGNSPDELPKWRWRPASEDSTNESVKSGWEFEGQKPTFDPKNGKWKLLSKKPRLDYRKNGETIASKIESDAEGRLTLAEDSPEAESNILRSKFQAIQKREEKRNRILERRNEEIRKAKPKKDLEPLSESNSDDSVSEMNSSLKKSTSSFRTPKREIKELGPKKDSVLQGEKNESARNGKSDFERNLDDRKSESRNDFAKDSISESYEPIPQDVANETKTLEATQLEKKLAGLKKEDLEGINNFREKVQDLADVNLAEIEQKSDQAEEEPGQTESTNTTERGEKFGFKNPNRSENRVRPKKEIKKKSSDSHGEEKNNILPSSKSFGIGEKKSNDAESGNQEKHLKERARGKVIELKKKLKKVKLANLNRNEKNLTDNIEPIDETNTVDEDSHLERELNAIVEEAEGDSPLEGNPQNEKEIEREIQELEDLIEQGGSSLHRFFLEPDTQYRQTKDPRQEKNRNFRAIDSFVETPDSRLQDRVEIEIRESESREKKRLHSGSDSQKKKVNDETELSGVEGKQISVDLSNSKSKEELSENLPGSSEAREEYNELSLAPESNQEAENKIEIVQSGNVSFSRSVESAGVGENRGDQFVSSETVDSTQRVSGEQNKIENFDPTTKEDEVFPSINRTQNPHASLRDLGGVKADELDPSSPGGTGATREASIESEVLDWKTGELMALVMIVDYRRTNGRSPSIERVKESFEKLIPNFQLDIREESATLRAKAKANLSNREQMVLDILLKNLNAKLVS